MDASKNGDLLEISVSPYSTISIWHIFMVVSAAL